jgi:ribosomal-protein-alanine N-acetyltransferase
VLQQDDLFNSFPSIQTKRLCLRQMFAGDAEDLFSFYRDPEFIKYLDWKGPSSIDQCTIMIDSWNRSFTERRLIPWGISTGLNNKLIGTIMFMPIRGTFQEVPRYPLAMGYDLKKEFWNKGIMTKALKAALDFSIKKIGPHRIQTDVLPEHTASIKLLKKLGFQEEGILKHYII